MTIFKNKMASLTINKKHLSVNEEHFSGGERNRGRSERASSLALPHSSLLDFYDKEQEQCNSIALLPSNVNMVVRRHSSHYYPMRDEKPSQAPQPTQLTQPPQHQSLPPATASTRQWQQQTSTAAMGSEAIAGNKSLTQFNYNSSMNKLLMQDMQLRSSPVLSSKSSPLSSSPSSSYMMMAASAGPSLPIPSIINNEENKYIQTANATLVAGSVQASASVAASESEPATPPPPPIPKRTFRGKYAWSGNGGSSNTVNDSASPSVSASPIQTPTKGKQQQQQQQQYQQSAVGTAFFYPQNPQQQQHQPHRHHQESKHQQHQQQTVGGDVYYTSSSPSPSVVRLGDNNSGLFVDIRSRSLCSAIDSLDASGISDDDHMSLENSVFDESLTSTPVKVASSVLTAGGVNGSNGCAGSVAKTLAAKTLAALAGSDLSSAAKRSNRSSSSTVDSSITTSSSGYGSGHSERFASTSTTADFRSRFSSIDTQSSLDSCLTEKTMDSPLPKESFKMDRTILNDMVMQQDHNNLNNNEMRLNAMANNSLISSNGNGLDRQCSTNVNTTMTEASQHKLPAVPVRSGKQYSVAPKIPPPHQTSQTKAPFTVSASTSTSSNASASSGVSSGSSMSLSAAAFNNTITSPTGPKSPNQMLQQPQKRQLPPTPPARIPQQSLEEYVKTASGQGAVPLTVRNKLNKHRPPPIVYPKLHQRQDSSLSSDSYSMTSSPGYNSKSLMEAPLLQNAARINKSGPGMAMRHQDSDDSFVMAAVTRYGGNVPLVELSSNKNTYRQDSNVSSDAFSQTSSPGYHSKVMEAPLLPSLSAKRLCSIPPPIVVCKQKPTNEIAEEIEQNVPMSPLTKCVSTPASLQTIVRFQNGAPNTMSLHHQIIPNRRKSSNPYISNGRLKFRFFQVLLNALALLAIAGGFAAYFNAYPTIKFVNKTIINTIHVEDIPNYGKNPAPGTCLPIIVKFCQGPKIPYNYTVFPNYIGHFGQLETQVDLDAYEALVDVRCYELVSLFLCSLFVPKCGSTGATVPPCKSLCTETMRRCGFFFDVFGLTLPEYLNCKLFKDFESPEDCVGLDQVRDIMIASSNPKCDGFQCDQNRCIPKEYVCDGHLDCMDQADEASCERCNEDEIYCGEDRCIGGKQICDGIADCPYGQDERNCIRLSERNGDYGKGVLEVFRIGPREWTPACVKNWDRAVSPSSVCSMLGYNSVNATSVITQKTHRPLLTSVNVSTDIWKMYAKKRSNLMQELTNCKPDEDYPIAELTCANYECGKVKRRHHKPARRIIGGAQANPGSWPFLAAILGGPEKIFYCAGVLISDQWVLTASHCIGNHTVIDLEDWTIQLGVTRRNSFTYTGQKVKVKMVIPHPQYNTAIAHDNDIALFQLATRVAFHEHLLPVCLPPPGLKQLKPDQLCTVIGWGKRYDKDPNSTYEPIVNEVQVPIIRRQQCDEWLDNLTVSDGMICAGYAEGGKDACQGDSGGPLLCPYPGETDRWFVGGIVSWGIMCAHPKLPGVYANVIKYVPWVQEQMQKYSKPIAEEKFSKYDAHPGGPDILSNMSTGPVRNRKPLRNPNRSPMDIDYYENYKKT